MSPGRHAASDTSFVRSAGGAATRGIILIVVAVIIGVVLIASGVDEDEPTIADQTTTSATSTPAATTQSTESTVASTSTSTPGSATTSPPPGDVFSPRAPNIVTVQVVNTTRVGGAAGRMTNTITNQGYDTLDPATASSGTQTETKILYINGYLLEAQALADVLQLDAATSVDSIPANIGTTIDNFLEPQILVLLGSDLAT